MAVLSYRAPKIVDPDALPKSLARAFNAGRCACSRALDEDTIQSNPYLSPEKRRYWRSGFLSWFSQTDEALAFADSHVKGGFWS